ncbi:hypothetical protein SPIRO4BDMA_40953 [uncultured spirochete]|uniref:Uncharacterized protein n=1 Tax=uncultured spirochete TaxID=156406 RepID=A0A3P3XQ19_9SPIR|nr:hypothetical protein SPIRO4BDMA_40953 [uncultured spirochete]
MGIDIKSGIKPPIAMPVINNPIHSSAPCGESHANATPNAEIKPNTNIKGFIFPSFVAIRGANRHPTKNPSVMAVEKAPAATELMPRPPRAVGRNELIVILLARMHIRQSPTIQTGELFATTFNDSEIGREGGTLSAPVLTGFFIKAIQRTAAKTLTTAAVAYALVIEGNRAVVPVPTVMAMVEAAKNIPIMEEIFSGGNQPPKILAAFAFRNAAPKPVMII